MVRGRGGRRWQDHLPHRVPRPRQSHEYLLVLLGRTGADGHRRPTLRSVRQGRRGSMTRTSLRPSFAVLLHDFFLRHLMVEKGASERTVEAYRDAFRLLLAYAEKRLKKQPVNLE